MDLTAAEVKQLLNRADREEEATADLSALRQRFAWGLNRLREGGGGEVYPVPFTRAEMQRFLRSLDTAERVLVSRSRRFRKTAGRE